MKVEHILQSKGAEIFSVAPDDKIADAIELLGEKNIGAVVVRDSAGDVAGILSERDIVRRLATAGAAALDEKVSGCMTCTVFTCSIEATVDELMAQMTEKRIRHLPVMNAGRLAGVVSIGDVVKRKIEQAEQEAAALKEYIAT